MKLTKLNFPIDERKQLKDLEALFRQWHTSAKNKNFVKEKSSEDIVFDGFYPFLVNRRSKYYSLVVNH